MHSQAARLQPHDFYLPCAIDSHVLEAPHSTQGYSAAASLEATPYFRVFPQASSTAVFDRLAADAARKGAGDGLRRTVSAKHGLSAGATRRGGQVRAANLVFSSAFLSDRACRLIVVLRLNIFISVHVYQVRARGEEAELLRALQPGGELSTRHSTRD